MKKRKGFLLLGMMIVATIGGILFIKYSNNHTECESTTLTYKDANGNKVTETQHICKEKFSF